MTGVVGVAIPVMITIGTVIGMGLRAWSREAQSQVGVAHHTPSLAQNTLLFFLGCYSNSSCR